jgi:sugar phosphate permease
MVGAGFGIQLLAAGLLTQSFGAYVAVLEEDFGWSKAALAGAFSFLQLIGGVMSPVQGIFIDRFGPRAIMRVGMVAFGVGFMILSQIDSLLGYYVAFIFIGVGFRLSGFFPLSVAVVNWFELRRARALSTMSLGVAVGGLVVPMVAFCLERFGWRESAFGSGVLLLVVGLPLVQVIRRRPEDYGEVVDGRGFRANARDFEDASPSRAPDFTARQAMRTPAFWLISLGHGSALLVVGAVMVHLISHLKDNLGYSVGDAALVVTLMTSMQVAGMLIGGTIGDRLDKRFICAFCMLMHMVGMLLLAFATALPMVVAFAVLHGLAWGIRGPLMQAMRADYFGRSSFGVIMGLSALIIMFGQISGPLVAGLLADATGTYEVGFTLMAILAGLGSLFFLFARRPKPPSQPQRRLRSSSETMATV